MALKYKLINQLQTSEAQKVLLMKDKGLLILSISSLKRIDHTQECSCNSDIGRESFQVQPAEHVIYWHFT